MIFVYIGWLATAAYLAGHVYLVFKTGYRPQIYYSLNLTGAIGFIISSGAIASWQSVIINIFWAYISLASLRGPFKMPDFPASRWWLIGPACAAAGAGAVILGRDFALGAAILGWAGTVLYIAGYYLFASGAVKQWQFLVYNTIAAIILLPVYAADTNWPAFTLSAVWSVISVLGLWKVRNTIRRETYKEPK